MFKKLSLIFCLYLSTSVTFAFPSDLMMENKPIDSLCFFNLENNISTINLQLCGIKMEKYILKGTNTKLIKKNYVGYNWQDSKFKSAVEGYSYYRYFNAGANQFWVYTINNGGGSGEFTAINLVKRKNNNIVEIKNIKGGDRCNGGISYVSSNNNKLLFGMNLTAYDLVALSNKAQKSLKAYDDIAACAICCVAMARYEVSAESYPTLLYVDINPVKSIKEMPNQGVRQSCFNKLLFSYINDGVTRLNNEQLSQFADKFNKLCV